MLKKVALVATAAAACLLAVGPLLFSRDSPGDADGRESTFVPYTQSTEGLVNLAVTEVEPTVEGCDEQIALDVLGVPVPVKDTDLAEALMGALGLSADRRGTVVETRRDDAAESSDCIATADFVGRSVR